MTQWVGCWELQVKLHYNKGHENAFVKRITMGSFYYERVQWKCYRQRDNRFRRVINGKARRLGLLDTHDGEARHLAHQHRAVNRLTAQRHKHPLVQVQIVLRRQLLQTSTNAEGLEKTLRRKDNWWDKCQEDELKEPGTRLEDVKTWQQIGGLNTRRVNHKISWVL